MKSLSALWRLLREGGVGQSSWLFVLMVLSALTEGFGVLLLVPLLGLLDASHASARGPAHALREAAQAIGFVPTAAGLLGAFVVLVACRSVIQLARERQGVDLEHRVVDRLRERCFRALMAAEWRWIAARRESDHANFLLSEVGRVGIGLHFGVNLLATLAAIGVYVAAAVALSWQMTAIALVSGGAMFVLLAGQRRGAVQLGEALGRANRALHQDVQESLAGIKLAKILGKEQRHVQRFLETTASLRGEQHRFLSGSARARAVFQFGGAALLAGCLYVGLAELHSPMPALLTLVLIFARLVPMCMQAQTLHYQWLNALPALAETERLLAACHAAAEPAGEAAPGPWPVASCIRLEHVTVRQPERERPALDDVSVTFAARTTTAIMGPSGAGKSTLADVLMGLLAPDEGVLSVDDAAAAGSLRKAWRHAVAYVPQDTFLFHDSIRNNLLWAAPDADDAALHAALERAAADFVRDLPAGLDTVVGDRGVRLSGGERQRLALARALLARPSLLILDEATSALDIDNEARVRRAIENLHGDLTVVIIGHRLPTLEHADQVLMLDAGRVVVAGDWAQTRAAMAARAELARA